MSRFGNLKLAKAKSIPFFTVEEDETNKNDFPEVLAEQYQIYDVLGDGNCGPYAFLLGVMNKSDEVQSARLIQQYSNDDYKEKVTDFRRRLRAVFTQQFIDRNKGRPFFSGLGFDSDDVLKEDFDAIYSEDVDYFPYDNLETHYQFPYALSAFGFSLLEKVRVALIFHQRTGDKCDYNTMTFDSRLGCDETGWYLGECKSYDGIFKIPDTSFDPADTVEILYSNFDGTGHFMFLKRSGLMSKKKEQKSLALTGELTCPVEEPPQLLDTAPASSTGDSGGSPDRLQREDEASKFKSAAASASKKGDSQSAADEASKSKSAGGGSSDPPQPLDRAQATNDGLGGTDRSKTGDKKKLASDVLAETVRKTRDDGGSKKRTMEDAIDALQENLAATGAKKLRNRKGTPVDRPLPYKIKYRENKNGEGQFIGLYFDNNKKKEIQIDEKEVNEMYEGDFISMLQSSRNRYLLVRAADAATGAWSPPRHLVTSVATFYQQADRDYCLPYSFASALKYCGLDFAAEEIASHADMFSYLPLDWALNYLQNLMLSVAPVIGRARRFNSRKKKKMTVDEILKPTQYPTVVVPIGKNGYCSHCLCVVDDLIFESNTQFALYLSEESFEWIFGTKITNLHFVYRFMIKETPKGVKLNDEYNRKIKYHH